MPLELRYIRGIYENWLRYNYSNATYKRTILTLEDFFSFFPEKSSPLSFLPGDVFRYIKARQAEKNLRSHLRAISKFFRWMIDHEYTTFDPVPAALRHPRIQHQVSKEPPDERQSRIGRAARERELLRERLHLLDTPIGTPDYLGPKQLADSSSAEPRFPHNPPATQDSYTEQQSELEHMAPAPAPRIVYLRGWGRPAPEVYPSLQELLSQVQHTSHELVVRLAYETPLRAIQLSSLTRDSFSSGSLIIPPNDYLPSGTFLVSGEILKIVAELPDGPIFGQTDLNKLSYQFRRIAYRAGYDCTLTEWILHCIRLRREDKWLPPPPASGKRAQKALGAALEQLQHPSSAGSQAAQYTIEPQPAD